MEGRRVARAAAGAGPQGPGAGQPIGFHPTDNCTTTVARRSHACTPPRRRRSRIPRESVTHANIQKSNKGIAKQNKQSTGIAAN